VIFNRQSRSQQVAVQCLAPPLLSFLGQQNFGSSQWRRSMPVPPSRPLPSCWATSIQDFFNPLFIIQPLALKTSRVFKINKSMLGPPSFLLRIPYPSLCVSILESQVCPVSLGHKRSCLLCYLLLAQFAPALSLDD